MHKYINIQTNSIQNGIACKGANWNEFLWITDEQQLQQPNHGLFCYFGEHKNYHKPFQCTIVHILACVGVILYVILSLDFLQYISAFFFRHKKCHVNHPTLIRSRRKKL